MAYVSWPTSASAKEDAQKVGAKMGRAKTRKKKSLVDKDDDEEYTTLLLAKVAQL